MTDADPAADWPTLEHVPVYDTHHVEKTDRTGAVVADEKVTRARLETIAATRNARIETTGNLTPVIVGHSRSDLPEWAKEKWSPTVGYADQYTVGERETDGRPVMYARMRLRPESTVGGETLSAEEIVRRFPCPSIERVLHADGLDAISLLHPSNPPARELGLIRMAAAADPSVTVSESPPMEDKCQALAQAIMQVLEQFLNGGGEAPPAAEPAAAAPTPAQYARTEPELEKVRMQREQEAIRSKRQDAELTALKAELADQKLRYQRERREKDLIQREAEGIELDRAEELDRLAALPEADYAKELARIDLRYQRSPAGSFIRTASVPEGGHDAGAGPFAKVPHHDAAHAYMMAHPGMHFHQALEAVKAGK